MTHTEYMREWRALNPEKVKAIKKASYQRHRESTLARQKVTYEANREPRLARQRLRRLEDPEGIRATQREGRERRRAADPKTATNRQRRHHLRLRYGMTADDFRDMLIGQAARCAICGFVAKLVIDHDHRTGRVRGLLCIPCNTMLGAAKDDPTRLAMAARYLG